jgi:hypothetical protein
LVDADKLDVKWHVPNDEETEMAIQVFDDAAKYGLEWVQKMLDEEEPGPSWTDELRQSLKYLLAAMLGSVPLFQRCPPQHDWVVERPVEPELAEPMSVDSEEEEEEEEEDDDDDAASGPANQTYIDGYINQPLNPKQVNLMQANYIAIGLALKNVAGYLWENRPDDMQAFIELSTVNSLDYN